MKAILQSLKIQDINPAICTGNLWSNLTNQEKYKIHTPIDNSYLASVEFCSVDDYENTIKVAQKASVIWRNIPSPKRGEIVRQIGNKLRENKDNLGKLVSIESGKILQEGLGEVQEMIDICDFAVGLSRQLQGSTMHSERPEHRMYDQYQPLGIVGIISAFNFPVAVWAWNSMIAAVCGNVSVWKPSEKTPLTAIACHKIIEEVLSENNVPEGVFNLIIGDRKIGELISNDTRIALVSATGSTIMGKKVAVAVANRLGKSLLELGGNNAIIITPNANLELAIRAVVFGAVGTAGQRCTSTRRVIIHASIYEKVKDQLLAIYPRLPIGNPLEDGVLVGPLIDRQAIDNYMNAINKALIEGGNVLYGAGIVTDKGLDSGNYVLPTIIEAENHYEIVQEETFVPILYLIKYEGEVENAIQIQNDVKQGLSSAIFSNHIQETEKFLSQNGSDCGIANVNIGTSGAEIGGAFGGEKETGGGRESGSDAWKAYMRRQTNTINYSSNLPLAQGIKFDL
jgi:aldehyde dehydrogenase (NAD+)